jgi:hypothetical protein
MKRLLPLLSLLGIAGLTSHVAQAHHALAANYDVDNIGSIEGVVVEVFWANPHVHYYMEVENESGETELWDIESSNLAFMMRSGWTRETVEVGDRIRISGRLGRNGIHRMELDRESLEILE